MTACTATAPEEVACIRKAAVEEGIRKALSASFSSYK